MARQAADRAAVFQIRETLAHPVPDCLRRVWTQLRQLFRPPLRRGTFSSGSWRTAPGACGVPARRFSRPLHRPRGMGLEVSNNRGRHPDSASGTHQSSGGTLRGIAGIASRNRNGSAGKFREGLSVRPGSMTASLLDKFFDQAERLAHLPGNQRWQAAIQARRGTLAVHRGTCRRRSSGAVFLDAIRLAKANASTRT